jgi:hypothetical protein
LGHGKSWSARWDANPNTGGNAGITQKPTPTTPARAARDQERLSMTYTTAQRDALKQAIVSGVLRLSYDGKNVEYRSMAELKAALNEVEASLARDSGKPQTRQIKIYADKDL